MWTAFALCAVLSTAAATTALETDLAMDMKERPVMKVVRLLQDTKVELEKELEDDKQAAIEAGKAKIAQLEASMGEAAAKMDELKVKRKETLDEVNADHKALMDATALRMKENKEFQASETDYLEAIDAAKNAIIVLGKHNPSLAQVRAIAHKMLDARVSQMVDNTKQITRARIDVLRSFLHNAESASSFLAIPGMQSYAPQSGQIFGILQQMKEDFEVNLAEAQKAEAKSKAQYEALKAAKEDEIDTGRKLIVSIDAQIAELQEKFAEEFKQLEDTQEQLAMDEEFLANLKEKCATMDADYEKRTKDRLAEIDAVTDTIKILNNDESFEAFDKMTAPNPPMFLQTEETSSQKERRQQAVSALQRAARVSGSPQIAMMAAAYDKKENLEAKIADLKKTIEQLTKDIEASKAAVAEMMAQMKKASETREAENADFQVTVNDHRVMSMILTKALDRMKQVYALLQQQKPGAPHIQTSGTHTDPGNGPAKFKKYEENAGGGKVVAMLEEVLADTKKTEDQAMASEMDSQTAYENFMKDSNKMITETQKAIADMTGSKASAEESLSMAKTDFRQTMTELEGLD